MARVVLCVQCRHGVTSCLFPFAISSSASTALSSTGYEGEWVDSDSSPNGRPDAGETIHYTIVVTNNGTVTLKNVEATSLTSGPVSCTDHLGRTLSQPVADLGVLEWYKCAGSHSVRAWRGRMWVRAMLLRLDQLVSSARRKAHHVREAVRVCWLSSGLV